MTENHQKIDLGPIVTKYYQSTNLGPILTKNDQTRDLQPILTKNDQRLNREPFSPPMDDPILDLEAILPKVTKSDWGLISTKTDPKKDFWTHLDQK